MNKPMIPSMGGREMGPVYDRYIEVMPPGLNVVEVGAWLGAGTYELASAMARHGHTYADRTKKPSLLYCYDWFIASSQEVRKAAGKNKYNPNISVDGKGESIKLKPGMDTLPIVRRYLNPFPFVRFIKGDIDKLKYNDGPIGILVVDAAKRKSSFVRLMQKLEPHLAKDAIIFFMDYWFHLYKKNAGTQCQAEYINQSGRYVHLESYQSLCVEVMQYAGRPN